MKDTFATKLTVFLSALILVLICAGCRSAALQNLTGKTWRWTSLEESDPMSISAVSDPENYTLTFQADGTLGLKLDCNFGSGIYTVSGSELNIELGMTTLAYCGDDSLDMQFSSLLALVDGYLIESGVLVLTYGAGAGRMIFEQG